MKYSPRLDRAIKFAAQKHDGHFRLERERLPYITHLMSVAILVSNHTDDEDCIIAALLHDTLEDTSATPEQIEDAFGGRVLAMVRAVTEPKLPTWRERKEAYIAQLRDAPSEALIIAAADKLHNIESKRALLDSEGADSHVRWGRNPSEYLWYHGAVSNEIQIRLNSPIASQLQQAVDAERAYFESAGQH